eukprot:ANDGO_01398.mRNA.1 hypothetical protein
MAADAAEDAEPDDEPKPMMATVPEPPDFEGLSSPPGSTAKARTPVTLSALVATSMVMLRTCASTAPLPAILLANPGQLGGDQLHCIGKCRFCLRFHPAAFQEPLQQHCLYV